MRSAARQPAGRRGAGAQLAAATRASCSWRVQVGFCGSSTAWPPAASILALAEALKAAALMVSGACSSPVPSTCRGGQRAERSWVEKMVCLRRRGEAGCVVSGVRSLPPRDQAWRYQAGKLPAAAAHGPARLAP